MHRALAETIASFSRGIERSQCPEDRKLAADYLAALAPLSPGRPWARASFKIFA